MMQHLAVLLIPPVQWPYQLASAMRQSLSAVCTGPQTLGLVFVAVYQKALKLLYVDALLEQVKQVGPLPIRPPLHAWVRMGTLYAAGQAARYGNSASSRTPVSGQPTTFRGAGVRGEALPAAQVRLSGV